MTKRLAMGGGFCRRDRCGGAGDGAGRDGNPNGGACTLSGTASFTTPLTATSQPFTYGFTGTLSNCHSGNASGSTAGPSGGTIAVTDGSGTGSCASSTTSGDATISWSDGNTTTEHYATSGVAAAVVLQGTVTSSTEPAVPVGDSAAGLVTFQPRNPQGCAPGGTGVSSAAINGVIGEGSQS